MDFPKDDFFNAQLRQLVFGVVKAAAILQAGHHLGEKYRKSPFKIGNHPKLREVKQKAVERFAVRWLDLSLDAQAQLLPASDREKLLETFDSVNDISNGELASLVKRSLISDMPLASVRPSIEPDGIQPIARTRFLGFLDRRQTRNRD